MKRRRIPRTHQAVARARADRAAQQAAFEAWRREQDKNPTPPLLIGDLARPSAAFGFAREVIFGADGPHGVTVRR